MKRVLVIAYYWPPSGGSGVQRWVKFCKYLPMEGWEPVVYAPSNASYPSIDEGMGADLPAGLEVIRRPITEPYAIYKKFMGKGAGREVTEISSGPKTWKQRLSLWIRANLFVPDPRVGWVRPSVKFLKKYLNLMKLRYSDNVSINLNVPDDSYEDICVAPMVFIPFVENAFKHGVSIDKPSTIDISIFKQDDRLLFQCHNDKSHAKHEFGGVGLNNVTKRLELIYGDDYSLDIKDEDNTYDVTLDLPVRHTSDFNDTKTTDDQ